MSNATDKIRNIALLGHGSNGKTSLAESLLFVTGQTDRLGRVADGNTVSDSDSEEIKRQISISTSAMFAKHKDVKINILDTPGYFDFAGEVVEALRVADAGIIVCSAKEGLNVGAEKAWKYLSERDLPKAIYVSKIDEENGDYEAVYGAFRDKYGSSVCPLFAPIKNDAGKVEGVIDLVHKKAYSLEGGKTKEIAIPDSMSDELEGLYEALYESAAETTEELMEKYLDTMELTTEEVITGIKIGFREHTLFPVFCGSAITGLGSIPLLDSIVGFFPSPADGKKETTEDGEEIVCDPNGTAAAIVFKTVSDQYGKFSYFKVLSGTITPDMTLTNSRSGANEKMGHVYSMQGKKSIEVKEVICGDIAAVSKLSDTKTGDTLCDAKKVIAAKGVAFTEPCYSMAIAPKTKGQEDKIASGLARLAEEDLTFTFVNNPETKQLVLSGAGDIQLDVLCSKLKDKFGVEVELSPARVAYREKIRKSVSVQGRHKKQSGGHGQFGDVWIRFEPQDETEDLVFAEEVFGGSVPKNFFPAVEKGLRDCIQKGVLAGYPLVYLKATLYDGSYHPVDSSEMAFKTAAGLAYKAGIPQANPVILEPIGYLTVTIPDTYMGDIMSDLSKRRGSPMGMSVDHDGNQIVEAEVPMGEMSSYAIDLRSMTQGRGSFTFKFIRYEEAPAMTQAKIIEEAKALAEAE